MKLNIRILMCVLAMLGAVSCASGAVTERGGRTSANNVVYDDFEGYPDSQELRWSWNENMEALTIDLETGDSHSPSQSMRLSYGAGGYYQVWRDSVLPDRSFMAVWFKGDPANADGRVFVRFLDSAWEPLKEFYYPGGTQVSGWTCWKLDISEVDHSKVMHISLGVDVSVVGDSDKVWFDDIVFANGSSDLAALGDAAPRIF